jgi:putative hemolysin
MNANPVTFEIIWTKNASLVEQAQALRYEVFQKDFAIKTASKTDNIDADRFDEYCDHLLIRHGESKKIVGTYRVLGPDAALRCGGLYSDNEFILEAFESLRPNLVEVGRSCVHPDFRQGAVILALWRGLGQYLKIHQYRWMLGCTSVPIQNNGILAASIAAYFANHPELQSPYRAKPIHNLMTETSQLKQDVQLPPLLKAYVRMGAQICGAPAYDPDFGSADFLTLLDCQNMNPTYARHFIDGK